jgi:hypothetical protein
MSEVWPAKRRSGAVIARRRARTRASWDAPTKQDFPQNDRIVVSLIMRCKTSVIRPP